MMKVRRCRYAIPLWLSLIATGCSVLAPQPDQTQYYILTAISDGNPVGGSSPVATHSDLVIGVGPIEFPGYLKRPEVVARGAGNRLQVSDVKRWGERLDKNFEMVLAQNLGQLLSTQRVVTYPWYGKTRIDYQVQVRVERFEATDNGQAQLSALWTIRDGSGSELATGAFRNAASATGPESDGAAALSQGLAELSRELAARIAEISARSPKTPSATSSRSRQPSYVFNSRSLGDVRRHSDV
jgi:hypothetical protein